MTKVAILSFYSGIIERGVETFAYEIASRLSKKTPVTLFQAGKPKPFQKFTTIELKSFGAQPKRVKGPFAKIYLDIQSLKILLFTLKVIPKILRGRYSVVIVLNGGWQTVVLRLISKLNSSKIIIPGEAGIGSDDAWNLLFRPDIFVALTKSQLNWARRLAPEVESTLIPNGVDLSKFNPKVSPAQIPLRKPIIVCTSALEPYKRVDLTIKAVAKTKNFSLLVLGDGQLRGQIDSLGKRMLPGRYLRIVSPYNQIPAYYKAGDVFTLASETEAFGTSYIEAMACNLPVVTTSDDSRAEIVGEAGILTDPADLTQYAKDLEIAVATDYKNKPYSQSLSFSWNKIASSYLSLINSLTNVKSQKK